MARTCLIYVLYDIGLLIIFIALKQQGKLYLSRLVPTVNILNTTVKGMRNKLYPTSFHNIELASITPKITNTRLSVQHDNVIINIKICN